MGKIIEQNEKFKDNAEIVKPSFFLYYDTILKQLVKTPKVERYRNIQ